MSKSDTSSARPALETILDKHGRETAHATMSSPGSQSEMFISPNQAIPVVFVPGIMGSPLISTTGKELWTGQGRWAWRPDSTKWVARGYGWLEAWQRKKLLDPATTRPVTSPSDADEEKLAAFLKDKIMPLAEAKRRGWGSVMISSYGDILCYLETQLRYIFYRGHLYPGTQAARPAHPEQWGELRGYERLTDDEFRQAAAWRFPVYAVGYNWVDSNGRAADYLKQRIDAIRHDCRERLKLKVDKVLLVTHSMGGLVARMCAKRYESDILGVIHGVQPAIGAGTAYARVRAGWESDVALSRPLESLFSMVGAWALGPTGREVTTVFANGAGPLELLPNQLYGSGWLKIDYKGRDGQRTLFSLPNADPYEEIYRVPDKWWRLVHPGALVEGESSPAKVSAAWNIYDETLTLAKDFHYELGAYYHPVTHAHCGADTGREAWHRITWRLESLVDAATTIRAAPPSAEAARDARLTRDPMTGNYCDVHDTTSAAPAAYTNKWTGQAIIGGSYGGAYYRATLQAQDDAGDATVPAHSGLAPRNACQFFAEMRGFDHQGSYNNEHARAATLYGILRIAANASSLS